MAARRLHMFIYITIANCCIFIIVCTAAIGTNQWFRTTTRPEELENGSQVKITVSYGLFVGEKTKINQDSDSSSHFDLKIVCQGAKGCMFSCGKTGAFRKNDFEDLYSGKVDRDQDYKYCTGSTTQTQTQNTKPLADEREPPRNFINFGFYLATLAFLALGIIFSIISGILALYNTYRTPIQPVLSVFGLYIWNSLSAAFVLLAMIMWVIEFAWRLRKNAAISDTISGAHDSSGTGSLGVSFWILLLPICFAVANVVILKYRRWKIVKMEEQNVRVMTEKLESGDILLF